MRAVGHGLTKLGIETAVDVAVGEYVVEQGGGGITRCFNTSANEAERFVC